MPLVNAETYRPQTGEDAMMTMEERADAARLHYGRLQAKGDGRLLFLSDGRMWWVPANMDELGADLASVLGNPVLATLMTAILENIAGGIESRIRGDLPTAAVALPDKTDAPPPDLTATQALLDVTMRMEKTHIRMVAALETLASMPNIPAPALVEETSQPLDNIPDLVMQELTGLGYSHEDGQKAAYAADGTAYVSLHNGVKVGDKEPVIAVKTPQAAVAATIEGINKRAVASGFKRIAWRQHPELQKRADGYVLRCRFAVIDKKEA